MDTDMNTNDYSVNLDENRTVVQQEQVVDYGQDFLRSRGLSVEEQGDGTKVLRVNSLNGLTPVIIGELQKKYNLDTVHINKNTENTVKPKNMGFVQVLASPKDESTYSVGQMKSILEKRDELIGDLQGNTKLSDLEKVILTSKRICEGITYDYEVVDKEHSELASQQESNRARNLTGTLIDGKAVCAGYSDLFYQAMDGLNIPVRDVGGIVLKTSGGHAWNQVQIDGQWYNVDLTNVDSGNHPFLDGVTSERKKCFLASDQEYGVISESEYLKNYSVEELGISNEAIKDFENSAFESIYGMTIEEYQKEFNESPGELLNDAHVKKQFQRYLNAYGKNLMLSKNPNTLMAVAATKNQEIEKCTESMSADKIKEAVENVKEYEKNELGIQALAPIVDEPNKIGFWQKVKNLFKKSDEKLALPEASGQNKGEDELVVSLDSTVAGSDRVSTVSSKDKGNEFRDGLKVSQEVLEENAKVNEEHVKIEKSVDAKVESVKEDVELGNER